MSFKFNKAGYVTANPFSYRNIRGRQKELKGNLTRSEQKLWKWIRGRKLGWRFRRQYIIDHFIVDFVCLPKKLIIEVDGEVHSKQVDYDKARSGFLEVLGFRVIRFSNRRIESDLKTVLTEIKEQLV